ncbi:MAG: histidinol dehydrogenase [bacterium]|nr:histidinol dehydrogenase [bacterium]
MNILSYTDENFLAELNKITQREAYSEAVYESSFKIIEEVKNNGDEAICRFALKFDNAELNPSCLKVTEKEIAEAISSATQQTKDAITASIENVTSFAKKQLPSNWNFSPRNGVTLGEKFSPLDRVGAYIPGGTAPLVSTVIHTVSIAKAAGVKEIAAVTPPGKNGKVNPDLLYALHMAGATEIYRIGGVYSIAALAYGTESIPKVQKIVGPGNAYVTAAKKIVYGDVSIDMVAGPSEIMIIADELNNPDFIAADMLSQIEHGSGNEQAVLATTSGKLITQVKKAILKQTEQLTRSSYIKKVLPNGVFLIETKDIEQAVQVANEYAPEHLEVMCRDAEKIAEGINAAGAIFLGEYTPEPVGDFVAGPSHVLPTGGSAKLFSGITVDTFLRRSSIINYTKDALKKEISAIETFAKMEGLDAHGNSAAIRFN